MITVCLATKFKDYLSEGGIGFLVYSGNVIIYEFSELVYDIPNERNLFYTAILYIQRAMEQLNITEFEIVSSNSDEVNRYNLETDAEEELFKEIKKFQHPFKVKTILLNENIYAIYLSLRAFKLVTDVQE